MHSGVIILWLSNNLPLKANLSAPLGLKVTFLCLQLMIALCSPTKFIHKMTSKSLFSMAIKSALSVTPFIVIRALCRMNFDIIIFANCKVVLRGLGILSLPLILKAILIKMKEYVAPESNNVYTYKWLANSDLLWHWRYWPLRLRWCRRRAVLVVWCLESSLGDRWPFKSRLHGVEARGLIFWLGLDLASLDLVLLIG